MNNLAPFTFDYPLGIRPWPNALRNKRNRPKEGYTFSLLENSTDSFRLTAMPGVGKLPELFRGFARLLPEEAFFILEFYEEAADAGDNEQAVPTVYYSPYLPIDELLATVEPYLERLIHDGFVGFGLANNRAGTEFFYSEEKILTCFTDNHLRMMNLFARLELPHRERLVFPTDFGHDHLSLLCHPRALLPEPFNRMSEEELDYAHFCRELIDQLEMYPVEETLAFFLSRKEQDQIEGQLRANPEFEEFAEEDFGALLLDWNDFVTECQVGFEGDLWEYRQGLWLRDMIEYVATAVSAELGDKLLDIIAEADGNFRKLLTDTRKRLDPPSTLALGQDRFWCHGVVRNHGVSLRRDLIRHGWFNP